MKINNNNAEIAFGYSKKSQSYLDKKIETVDEPELREAIKQYSDTCNRMEDKINRNERIHGSIYSSSGYVDLFLSMKDLLLTQVVCMFDDGDKYLDSEYRYYASAPAVYRNDENNWRTTLLKSIRYLDTNAGKTEAELKAELEETKRFMRATEAKRATDCLGSYAAEKSSAQAATSPPFIERLTKTRFSPSGFGDIAGMEKLKASLTENIVNPVNNPKQAAVDYEEYGKEMPSGILLWGPPGCGKTYIIEALSEEIDSPVYMMNSANTGSKFVNQTSNNIKKAFEYVYAEGDRSQKPVLMFMDEIDAMTNRRGGNSNSEDVKSVATLLKCIEEARAHNVIVVGATNRYDMVDPAIRRRFDIKEFVGLPEKEQRKELLIKNLSSKSKGQNLVCDEEALDKIAQALKGYSYSSIGIIADSAALNALRRGRADIEIKDFDKAIRETGEEKINERDYTSRDLHKAPRIGFASESVLA